MQTKPTRRTAGLSRLLPFLKPQLKNLVLCLLMVLLVNAAELIKPYILEIVIDRYLTAGRPESGWDAVWFFALSYLLCAALSSLLSVTEAVKVNRMGQSILMEQYRHFVRPEYSVRQVLVEHQHFNDPEKREHIRKLFLRAKEQGAIPIVNYNDPVSDEENRKWELSNLRREHREVHECVDNDETAAVIAGLVTARTLLIMTSTEGIYADPKDPKTLIRDVEARTPEEMERKIRELQTYCMGASRAGANGAHAKLEYALGPAMRGTTVIIGHGRHRISDLLEGRVACTRIGLA